MRCNNSVTLHPKLALVHRRSTEAYVSVLDSAARLCCSSHGPRCFMNWERERDALLARTLEFVQTVARKKENARPGVRSDDVGRHVERRHVDMVPPAPLRIAEPTADNPPPGAPLSRPKIPSDLQREFRDRIEGFRKHQERFNRERAEYFNATLARLRAAIDEGAALRIDK